MSLRKIQDVGARKMILPILFLNLFLLQQCFHPFAVLVQGTAAGKFASEIP